MNNTTSALSNQTTVQGWTASFVAVITVSSVSFILNVGMLLAQFLPQMHITSFTVYLIALSIANIVHFAVLRPVAVVFNTTGIWPGGHALCVVYSYVQAVVSNVPVFLHVLISLNRLWALKYPALYRERHNKTLATLLCLGAVAYVHCVILPVFLWEIDQSTLVPGICKLTFGNKKVWRFVDVTLHRLVPVVIVIGIYVYIMVKRLRRRRVIEDKMELQPPSSHQTTRTAADDTAKRRRSQRSKYVKQRKVKPFIVLTMTSASVLVCWVPTDIYFVLLYADVYTIRQTQLIFSVTTTIYSLQMASDPLMWLFSLR
ncbi:5-hydroxytryptamine receptor 1B-like [Paramacrobiotus metropolitanus]|uniref:5-hydroxytryptamine receptor 1B-like n=1 Tax=Paramacrobiotus metropolitanus TaxID=2943436 RepID=UPI0024464CB4|nr:5-hydroxytryptamine receptor 1B-like [Paramacrobiotus metropolitanus]